MKEKSKTISYNKHFKSFIKVFVTVIASEGKGMKGSNSRARMQDLIASFLLFLWRQRVQLRKNDFNNPNRS